MAIRQGGTSVLAPELLARSVAKTGRDINYVPAGGTTPQGEAERIASEAEIERQRELAQSFAAKANSNRDIKSVWQGLAHVADSALSGWNERKADTAERERRDAMSKALLGAVGDPSDFGMTAEQLAGLAKTNPEIASSMLAERWSRQTDAVKQRSDTSNAKYGMSPVYGIGPDDETVYVGQLKPYGGVAWTGWDGDPNDISPVSPEQLGEMKSRGAEIGKVEGAAKAALSAAYGSATNTVGLIDELLLHPGLNGIVGRFEGSMEPWMLGEKERDALARYNQLYGKAFSEAYETLKGGGPITDIEGQKAGDALARMQRYQSEPAFRKALTDFRDAIHQGMQKLAAKANDVNSVPDLPPAPEIAAPPQDEIPDGTVADGPDGPMIKIDGNWEAYNGK